MSGKNGNVNKGNNPTKSMRRRKNPQVACDANTDRYAKVVKIEGGKRLSVLPLEDVNGKPITVIIPGKFHKRVFFKIDDYVVITDHELKGKVNEGEVNKIKNKFEKLKSGNNDTIIFDDDVVSDDCEDNNVIEEKIDFDSI